MEEQKVSNLCHRMVSFSSEVIGKMLQSKLPQLPGEHKTCAAHAECSGSAKCLAFPKFEKQMCLVGKFLFSTIQCISVEDENTITKKKIK